LNLKIAPPDLDYRYFRMYSCWVRDLGFGLACIYGLLFFMSKVHGFCYASDKYLASEMGVSKDVIRKSLRDLVEHGYIFRNTYPINRGAIRQIVIWELATDYWKNHMSKPQIPKHVKEKFIKFYKAQPRLFETRENKKYELPPLKITTRKFTRDRIRNTRETSDLDEG